jgi:hypothetical protein
VSDPGGAQQANLPFVVEELPSGETGLEFALVSDALATGGNELAHLVAQSWMVVNEGDAAGVEVTRKEGRGRL